MSVHDTAKSLYLSMGNVASENRVLDAKWFAEQEVNTWSDWMEMPLRRRVWLWRQGFLSANGRLYDFETHDPELFLSHLQMYRLYKRANGNHRYLLDDKLSQHWMLSDHSENRPSAFGLLDDGYVHGLANTEFQGSAVPLETWLPEKLRAESALVLKQLRGEGGNEVIICSHDEDGFTIDEERVEKAELCTRLSSLSSYLVTEYIDQHAYANDLYPHSPNTVRVLTVWDDVAGELYLAGACQRIGTDRSRPVDNFGAGGLSAAVDIDTGVLGQAVQYPFSGTVQWFDTHPDTGTPIEGASVKHWDRIRDTVEQVACDNTNIPIIGWDVLLSTSGEPIIIEGNTGTHLDLLQAHGPLLADENVARVISRYLPELVQ